MRKGFSSVLFGGVFLVFPLWQFRRLIRVGMSAPELEMLAGTPPRYRRGLIPWVCWESENSSYGKCFRQWAGFPRLLPLFVNSCHGAYHGSLTQANEIDERAEAFFGWPQSKVQNRIDLGFPRSYLVQHPWVSYRQRYFPRTNSSGKGIVFFYPHSNSNFEPKFSNPAALESELRRWNRIYGGLTICLSFHDVQKGLHEELVGFGFPLVTLGSTLHSQFVDRFYSLLSAFQYSASAELGSQVYFALEAGQVHLLSKEAPIFLGTGEGRPLGEKRTWDALALQSEIAEIQDFERNLRNFPVRRFRENQAFAARALAVGEGISGSQARSILWSELRRNWPRYASRIVRRILH